MIHGFKDLAQCADVVSLGSELRALCSEFGSVSRLDILTMTNSGKRRAVCLLRLNPAGREQELMTALGANRFGEDLCVVVDLEGPAPRQTWSAARGIRPDCPLSAAAPVTARKTGSNCRRPLSPDTSPGRRAG
jgi:hypothetical protein